MVRRGMREFHFWLLNDQLLYGEYITPIGLYTLNRQINLSECIISTFPDSNSTFIIESPAKSFVVYTK